MHLRGKPELRLSLNLVEPDDPDSRTTAGQFVTAGPALRAIPHVVDAPPGVIEPSLFAPFTAPR